MAQETRGVGVPVIADTSCGKVRGARDGGVTMFRGIPYGGPTDGPGRFLPPARPEPCTGVRDCTVTGPRCVQGPEVLFLDPVIGVYFGGGRPDRVDLARQPESESCLNLNVLTPGLAGKRPVMVYIHGGGFTGGSSALTLFADRFVAEQDVVLVGVNHRLNAFGYLYLGELSEKYAVGNVGQLDLIAALEWVRDNIAGFGGDPANVTVFGESGGGAKISTLMAMPAAKRLFHRAIVESGSMLCAADRAAGTAAARTVLAGLGLEESRVDQLAQVPAADLYAVLSRVQGSPRSPLMPGPVVDDLTVPHQTWDPAAPPEAAGVPLLVGNCKDELTLFMAAFNPGDPEAVFRLDDAGLHERLVAGNVPPDEVGPLLALYRRDHPGETPSDLYFRIATDRGARWNAVRQAELKVAQGAGDVYMYYFAWNTPCGGGRLRAFHTAELPLAMRLVAHPEAGPLSRQISAAWAAFARIGDPGHPGLPPWPTYTLESRATMVFDAASSAVIDDPDGEERRVLRGRPSGSLL
jgi:para-nitrobenzyl esterase